MYLVIDCTKKEQIALSLVCSAIDIRIYEQSGRQVELLMAIHTFFTREHIEPRQVSGVCALTGEGSFTSSRLAVLCGNVFHFVYGVPVVTMNTQTICSFDALCTLFRNATGGYVVATYSGLPNIRS